MSHFREHVEVIDAIGEQDVSRIARHVEESAGRDPGPATRAPDVGRRVSVLRAKGPDRLVLDPAGYLVVTPDRRRGLIAVEHYGNDGVLRTVVEGEHAEELAATLLREKLVTRLDHAAYIGRELTRAEIALMKNGAVRPGPSAGRNADSGSGCRI